MSIKCACRKNCVTIEDNLDEKVKKLRECENCLDITIKKFSPLSEIIDLNDIDSDYKRCECGKRPIDIVMSHILKIMIEEETVGKKATLRRNSPVPLSDFYYGDLNPQFINKNTLILIHPDFNSQTAERLINEVPEVKGVLKGNPSSTIGQLNKDSKIENYELLAGCDIQSNVMRTINGDKIIINKKQSQHHIEVAATSERKLVKLHNYLENNDIKKGTAVDAMCGCGILGIYLHKYGFEKVIFNDIYPEAIENLKENLKTNEITEGYEIYNEAFEDLNLKHGDLCVIDPYPNENIDEIIKKAEKLADNVIII